MSLLVLLGVALVAVGVLVVLLAMLPDDLAAILVTALVGLAVLYGLVRFVKWAWQG